MKRMVHAILAFSLLISSLSVTAAAEEGPEQQILDFLQQDASTVGVEESGYTV